MNLITQPNSWSCALASAAMVFDCPIEEIISLVGHDGNQIVHPDLTAPACYKAIHTQEIVDVAFIFGYSMIPIETLPVQTPDGQHEWKIKKWGLFKDNEQRLRHYLEQGNGLIVGQARKYWHTVAWDRETQQIYDPQGRIYNLDDCKINIQAFWLIKSFDK